MYNYNLDFGPWGTYRIFKTSATTSKTEILATISGRGTHAAYLHSFFLTEDYVILCVWPSHLKGSGASILWERNILDAIKFDPTAETKWYVVDRKGGRGHVATFKSPAFFSFHTANAFQEEDADGKTTSILCDIIQFPDDSILRKLFYENLLSTGTGSAKGQLDPPTLVRYKLPGIPKHDSKGQQGQGGSAAEVVTKIPGAGDLPTFNPLHATKPQRYVYGVVDRGYSSFMDGISKADLETKEVVFWGKEPKPHTPGEAIFVPDGTNESEDAGYLLSVVLDGEKGTSYLLCLNARDMTEVARAECDHPIGIGFHGGHYKA